MISIQKHLKISLFLFDDDRSPNHLKMNEQSLVLEFRKQFKL